jgi:pimeloyl-ACP methyl ester carboxylesterase
MSDATVTPTDIETRTLEVPGAVLTYDVRRNPDSTRPALMIIGSPMGAEWFGTLAGHFADRTVVTYDPRGVDRSRRTDSSDVSTPEEHADDVHRVLEAVGAGPVDLFASSGGAVNALVLVAEHPEAVRTLVAHEPPAATALPDREEALAASRAVHETYLREGNGPAMARFITLVSHRGEFPADWADGPAPDPTTFGLPTEDDGRRDDVLLQQNMISCTHHQHDLEALRTASTRVVLGAGEESEGELANRGAHAIAAATGRELVAFPSHHGGFLGGEGGQMPGKPDEFAARLREVLDGTV